MLASTQAFGTRTLSAIPKPGTKQRHMQPDVATVNVSMTAVHTC